MRASSSDLRLLLLVRPATGGIRQHVITLTGRLVTQNISVEIAGPAGFLDTLPPELANIPKHPIEISASFNPIRDFIAARGLRKLAQRRYDIIHAHGLRAGFISALAGSLSGAHCIITLHNLLSRDLRTRLALGYIAKRTDGFIAVSKSVGDDAARAVPPGALIEVVPNGIPIDYFAEQVAGVMERSEGLSVIGCVARLSREKGVDVLLEAARLLPEHRFLVAGDGPDRATLSEIAPSNVTQLGRVEDVRSVYAASDIVVVPSRLEGQGIVALEALAAGKPLIASRVGGLAETLEDRETALLVPVGDVGALRDAIVLLLSDEALRKKLIENGPRLVRSAFDDESMATKTLEFYRSLLIPPQAA